MRHEKTKRNLAQKRGDFLLWKLTKLWWSLFYLLKSPSKWLPKSSNCDMLWNMSNTQKTPMVKWPWQFYRVVLRKNWVHPFHNENQGGDWSGKMSSCRTLIEPLGPGRLPKSALHDSKITFFSAGYLNFQEALHLSTVQPSTIFFTNFQYETYFCFCRLALQKHLNFTVSLRSKVT